MLVYTKVYSDKGSDQIRHLAPFDSQHGRLSGAFVHKRYVSKSHQLVHMMTNSKVLTSVLS